MLLAPEPAQVLLTTYQAQDLAVEANELGLEPSSAPTLCIKRAQKSESWLATRPEPASSAKFSTQQR